MNGVLVVDKPTGPTSHDVVASARRALGLSRIGHTGTLDPLASGVLPLVVGRATRLAALLSATVKEYVADVRFGAATATYDAEERVVRDPATRRPIALGAPPPEPPGLTEDVVRLAVGRFQGTHVQAPPPYSAKKIGGVAAYRHARRNVPVAPPAVSVTVHAIELERYADGLARVRLACSAGFYVRSFAHELGQQLECGAHLEALRRERAGDFAASDAVPLDLLETEGRDAARRLIPLERLLPQVPGVVLTDRGRERASHGSPLLETDFAVPAGSSHARLRLLDSSGTLVGIAEPGSNGALHPVIVLV